MSRTSPGRHLPGHGMPLQDAYRATPAGDDTRQAPTPAATDGDGPYGPYKVHRFLEDFPLLGDGEFADFVASVKRRGLMEPITLTHDRSTIVDGRIRYLACIEAGVDPVFETLPERYDDQMILDLIWTRNVYRQNLTVEQRAEIEQRAAAVYADFDGQLTGSGS